MEVLLIVLLAISLLIAYRVLWVLNTYVEELRAGAHGHATAEAVYPATKYGQTVGYDNSTYTDAGNGTVEVEVV